jgi:flavin reductase (DIM6/NTAB) family NADH-FMN oxidoreductase RutF
MNNMPDFSSLVGADALKATFRRHASGVAVVTSATESGEPLGFTATSVTSLGSNPPLVSFNIAQGSSSYPHLQPGRMVALHTLAAENLGLAQKMAGPREQRFGSNVQLGPENTPIFPEATAILLCRIRSRHEVESNAVIVLDALSAYENSPADPLLYFQRGYLTAGTRLADNS